MLLMPYDTKICSVYKLDQILNQLKRAEIDEAFPEVLTPAGNTIKGMYFVTPSEDHSDIKYFTQFLNMGTDQEPKLVLDGRPFMREDRRSGTYRLTAANDYMFQCVRGALTIAMLKGDVNLVRRLGDIPAVTFARWITMALAQRYNLDLLSQRDMQIVCAYYYYSLSDRELTSKEKGSEARVSIANMVARIARTDRVTVLEVIDKVDSLESVEDLVRALTVDIGTIRTGELKFGDLFTLISHSFFGVNARENVGVALEHLPTFIAMIYTAASDRSYRKTTLTRRVETAGKTSELKQFCDQVYRHVSEQFK